MAMMKYIINKKKSSVLSTRKVKRGGIKKKSHVNALKKAANNTGKISKNRVSTDTVTSRRKATTRYPMIAEKK